MIREDAPMSTLLKHRFTVEKYDSMVAAGILTKDDRVELIEGEIVQMSPIGPRHAAVVDQLTMGFASALKGQAIVRIQGPITAGPDSEPQPDVSVLKPRADAYETHPEPEDILLLIEVSNTSRDADRAVKLKLYAGCGIREYWIVNLEEDRFEIHRSPRGEKYSDTHIVGRGQAVSPEAFPGLTLEVDSILG